MSPRKACIVFLLALSFILGTWIHVIAEDDPRGVVDTTPRDEPDYSRGFYSFVGFLGISFFYVAGEKILTTLRSKGR
jgi:hypothetical protein